MNHIKEIRSQFRSVKGAKFLNVNGYFAKSSGEIANHNIIVNVDVLKAKEADLLTLKNFPASQLNEIATKVGASKEDALRGIEELIISAEKNLSKEFEDRTNQSKAQSDAYLSLGKGLRVHLDTLEVYVSGFANSKVVLKEGVHKSVNSKPKTLVKKAVSKTLKMSSFRQFKLGQASTLAVSGSTIQL